MVANVWFPTEVRWGAHSNRNLHGMERSPAQVLRHPRVQPIHSGNRLS